MNPLKQWEPLSCNKTDQALVPGLSSILDQIFRSRGFDAEAVESFLNPSLQQEFMVDQEALAQALDRAMKRGEPLQIFGDYDVDGMSASALLWNFFSANGIISHIVLPNRYLHGYGLNSRSLELIRREGLLITVDCGVGSAREVEQLMEEGMEVFITDHHELPDTLPETLVMNPKRGDYPFRHLSGSGVALKLVLSLEKLGYYVPRECWVLAMLGTISDVMPLVGENRMIVQKGLQNLEDCQLPGLLMLIRRLQLEKVRASDVAFTIAPHFNAAGRMEEADIGLPLLLREEHPDLSALVEELIHLNQLRKDHETFILSHFGDDSTERTILISSHPDWKSGVLGLAAARLADRYRVPVILLSQQETLKGSGRSVGSFHLLKALEAASSHLLRFGGHQQAVGLELSADKKEDFVQSLESYCREHLTSADRTRIYRYLDITPSELTMDLLRDLDELEPFGVGNPRPLFRLQECLLKEIRHLGKEGLYFRFLFEKNSRRLSFVCFQSLEKPLREGRVYDLLFSAEPNLFRGVLQMQFQLKDIRKSLVKDPLSEWIEEYFQKPEVVFPDREELVSYYRRLKGNHQIHLEELWRDELAILAVKIFEELGIISYTILTSHLLIQWHPGNEKLTLDTSATWRRGRQGKE